MLIGHLHLLWWWSLEYAPDGNLSDFDSFEIADAAGWDGDPDTFIEHLVDCGPGDKPGFLERNGEYGAPDESMIGNLVIHDWWDYAGKLIAKRQADAERKRKGRAKAENETSQDRPTDVQRTSNGRHPDVAGTVPYRTVHTEPDARATARSILLENGLTAEQVNRSYELHPETPVDELPSLAESCFAWHRDRRKKIKSPYQTWLNWLRKDREFRAREQEKRGSPPKPSSFITDDDWETYINQEIEESLKGG